MAQCVAQLQTIDQHAHGGAGCFRVGQVMDDVRMVKAQRAGSRVMAVAFLGHRQAHDPGVGGRDVFKHRLRVFGCDQQAMYRANHLELLAWLPLGVRIANGQCVKPVLRCKGIARIGLAQGHAGNAPAQVTSGYGSFRGSRHVGAHESANAQMHDAGFQLPAVVGRAGHGGWQGCERGVIQSVHIPHHQLVSVPSCCSRLTGR